MSSRSSLVLPGVLAGAMGCSWAQPSASSTSTSSGATGGGGSPPSAVEAVDLGGGHERDAVRRRLRHRHHERRARGRVARLGVRGRPRRAGASPSSTTPRRRTPRGRAFAPPTSPSTARRPASLHLTLADQGNDAALVSLVARRRRRRLPGPRRALRSRRRARPRRADVPRRSTAAFESGTNDAHVPVPFVVDIARLRRLRRVARGRRVRRRPPTSRTLCAPPSRVDALDVRSTSRDRRSARRRAPPTPATPALPRRPPLWSLAPMHWRNEWTDAATLLADARRVPHAPHPGEHGLDRQPLADFLQRRDPRSRRASATSPR